MTKSAKLGELFASGALSLGQVTYQGFAAAWPSRTDEQGYADRTNSLPKFLVSTTLQTEEQVLRGNFGWIRKRMGDHLEVPNYFSVYVAYVGEQSIFVGWIYWHPNSRFASLHGGATLPDYRGQGVYMSVLAVRTQEAIQRGYHLLTIEASPMSHPIVAKHGFRVLTHVNAYRLSMERSIDRPDGSTIMFSHKALTHGKSKLRETRREAA